MRKKRILFVTNYPNAKTGFANYIKRIITFIYKTGKYDIALLAAGMPWGSPDFKRYPFKVYGAIPVHIPEIIQKMNQDPGFAQAVSYGKFMVDEAVKDFEPDIVVGLEDPWGQPFEGKKWVDKLSCIVHTTIDSRPILPQAIELAKITKHFYTWADFPIPDFKKLGFDVKSIKAVVNTDAYKKLPDYKRKELRQKFGIPEDSFITGMVFRNQLRKSIPNLIEGAVLFKKQNPHIKNFKLLCATHFNEGWNIHALCDQYGFDKNDLLCVYKCRANNDYFVMPFQGQDLDNPITKTPKSLITINVQDGITDEQMNEVYNLMDCYSHPHTSGGAELPIFEAKLAELVTLVTNYSSGEDACVEEAKSLPLDFAFYTEIGTQFLKASTYASSIAKQLKKFYDLDYSKKRDWGRAAREFTLKNYSLEVVGKQWESIFDELPLYEGNRDFWTDKAANLNATPPQTIATPEELVLWAYKEILQWPDKDVNLDRDDLKNWVNNLKQGMNPNDFLNTIRGAGVEHNKKLPNQITPEQYLRNSGVKEDAVLVVFKESGGDAVLLLSLFKSLRDQYSGRQICVSIDPRFREVFEGCEYIDNVIDYQPFLDSQLLLQGQGTNKALVYKSLHPRCGPQMNLDYLGEDKIALNLEY